MALQMLHQFRHGLLGHLRAFGEFAHRRAGVVEVLEDGAVGRTDETVPALGQADDHEPVHLAHRLTEHAFGVVGGRAPPSATAATAASGVPSKDRLAAN